MNGLPMSPVGLYRLVRLNRLKASARNCTFRRSVTCVFLNSDKSKSLNAGPRKALRLRFPLVAKGTQGVPIKKGTRPLGQNRSIAAEVVIEPLKVRVGFPNAPLINCFLLKPLRGTLADGVFGRS